jgi:hypothetical protein
MDPEAPDGENPFPVPLQAVALALVQERVDDWPPGMEVGDAEKVTVGAVCALELTTCPAINNGEASKPSPIADIEFRNMWCFLNQPELELADCVAKTPRLCLVMAGFYYGAETKIYLHYIPASHRKRLRPKQPRSEGGGDRFPGLCPGRIVAASCRSSLYIVQRFDMNAAQLAPVQQIARSDCHTPKLIR